MKNIPSLFVYSSVVWCCLTQGITGQMRCYGCSFSASDTDRSCLTISEATNTVSCSSNNYCTIYRQEYIDPTGEIASFMRGCEEQPDFLNHDIIDSNFRTYYRACTSNLCNTGDGREAITGGNLSPNQPNDGDNLLVPGTAFASKITLNFGMLVLTTVICMIFTTPYF